MAVISLIGYKPVERYDEIPWTQARLEESDTDVYDDIAVWTEVETFTLSPVDTDPSDPAYRNFTTELASATPDLWYRIVWVDATADESTPTEAVQNEADDTVMFATVSELARILKIRTPTAEQESALERVLIAASGEVNSEIDLADASTLSGWQLALAAQVTLERGAELWKLQEVQFGIVMGSEFGATHMARNTWDKHAYTLAPLKEQLGIG